MFHLREAQIEDFKRVKGTLNDEALSGSKRITFYRTKSGCYTPPPYVLKYRKLSEVL